MQMCPPRTPGFHVVWAQGGLGSRCAGSSCRHLLQEPGKAGRAALTRLWMACAPTALQPRRRAVGRWAPRIGVSTTGCVRGQLTRRDAPPGQGLTGGVKARPASLPWASGLCFWLPHRGQGCHACCQSGQGVLQTRALMELLSDVSRGPHASLYWSHWRERLS